MKILNQLEKSGLKVKTLFSVYGKEYDEWIVRSKLALNHHFYDAEIFEIIRAFYPLANSIAAVGHVKKTTSIDSICTDGILASQYDELVSNCVEVVQNQSLLDSVQKSAIDTISK